ncbi:MAG: 20S proteasome beta subunit [Candidatus Methanohalarchaeum thermophilum]|uniref:Proteasome subunit beta n=1 Tax=Methanohalarchaeum thermophilum TaxID=1903181 RepID=A0A1Q6DXJ4_METT1|nr:MAG: 20S proteasome beta subunit [Candidatus Methanohalarchaeum thermophilum]
MESGEEFKGTTTVGIVCKDGVVLGTERRASMSNLVASKRAKKVFQVHDRLGLTMAGSVGDAQQLVRTISAEANLYQLKREKEMSVKAASTMMSNILRGGALPYYVQLILGGFDKEGPRIFVLDPTGGNLEEKMVSTGSGSPIAYGVLEDRYDEEMSIEDGINLVIRAITSAMKRDTASGDGIDVAKITEEGFEILDDEKVKGIREEYT